MPGAGSGSSAAVIGDELQDEISKFGTVHAAEHFGPVLMAGINFERLFGGRVLVENCRIACHEWVVGGLHEQDRRLYLRVRVVHVESPKLDRGGQQDESG